MQEIGLVQKLGTPIKEWKDSIINDFEESVFPNHAGIEKIKNKLYNSGAEYASMTGSGAAVFGIFEKEVSLNFEDCFVWREKL